jgi:hypothetical protein
MNASYADYFCFVQHQGMTFDDMHLQSSLRALQDLCGESCTSHKTKRMAAIGKGQRASKGPLLDRHKQLKVVYWIGFLHNLAIGCGKQCTPKLSVIVTMIPLNDCQTINVITSIINS